MKTADETTQQKYKQLPAVGLTFNDVFSYPQYTLRGMKDWSSVSKLGSNNIVALISRARSNEKELTESIARKKEQVVVLQGKSAGDFKKMASEFDNPKFTDIGIPGDSWSRDLEPLDAESKNRERNSTSFNICGWCKNTSGGTGRYSYMITTRCSLLGNTSPEACFNTPCLLQSKTTDEIATQVERIESEIAGLLVNREKVRGGIRWMQYMKRNQPKKPYLMSLRPHDHFNVGDEVMVYIGQWGEDDKYKSMVKDGVWVPAIVVFGYRHHDGCVSYQTLFPIHTNMSNFEGRGGGAGMSRPEVLLRSEFNYLREAATRHDDFFYQWLDNLDSNLKGLDLMKLRHDFVSGEIAKLPVDWQPPTDEIVVNTVKDAERVLQMLDSKHFKTEQEIKRWAAMQLRCVHPDKLGDTNENVREYAERQTRAVYAARDLLIAQLKSHK